MKRSRILLLLSVILIVLCQSVSVSSVKQKTHAKKKKNSKPHHLAYFYDIKSNRTLKPPMVSFEEDELERKAVATPAATPPVRPTFGRKCDCKLSDNRQANVCSCCAGVKLPRIRFQREICTRFQYNLSQRNQMLMDVTMNGNAVASQTFNFRAPDLMPLCIPLPVPIIPLRFDACIKLFDVNFMGQNAHFCMDWSARVEMAPLILLHFDCAQFGSQGVSFLKPGQLPQQPDGGFPSVLQPETGGGGTNPGIVSGAGGGGGGGEVSPVDSALGGTTAPETPSQQITTNPATGPDENGNLPQVAAGDGDFDSVDDLKLKMNTTRYNTNNYNYHYNRL